MLDLFLATITQEFMLRSLTIVLVGFFIYVFVTSLAITGIEHGIRLRVKHRSKRESDQRIKTLTSMIKKIFRITFLLIIVLMVFTEMGINIAPILTGAGVLGLAVSFGSQSLVKDFLSGLFILIEGQYGIGDFVQIAGIKGTVHEVSLRRTVLRDQLGTEHHVPNSSIKTVSNYTKEWSGVQVDVPVSYDVNVETVLKTAKDVAKKVSKRTAMQEILQGELTVQGIVDYTTNGMVIRIVGSAEPNEQWTVEQEVREAIQKAFRQKKILLGASQFRF